MIRFDADYTLGISLNELMKRDDLIEALKRVGDDVFIRTFPGGIQIVSDDLDVIGYREQVIVDDNGKIIQGDISKYNSNSKPKKVKNNDLVASVI